EGDQRLRLVLPPLLIPEEQEDEHHRPAHQVEVQVALEETGPSQDLDESVHDQLLLQRPLARRRGRPPPVEIGTSGAGGNAPIWREAPPPSSRSRDASPGRRASRGGASSSDGPPPDSERPTVWPRPSPGPAHSGPAAEGRRCGRPPGRPGRSGPWGSSGSRA